MTSQGNNAWTGTIPGYAITAAGVDYYIRAVDASAGANPSTDPANAPAVYHEFSVVTQDRQGPVITHTPVSDGQPAAQPLSIAATITDPSGVADATLFYRASDATDWSQAKMAANNDLWTATIPGSVMAPPGVDYYILATDASADANVSTDPEDAPAAFHTFSVVADQVDTQGPVLNVTPIADDRPYNQAVDVRAIATDASGVADVTLHYRADGQTEWTDAAMILTSGQYIGQIPADAIRAAKLEYYVDATDTLNNESVWPATAPAAPAAFTIGPAPDTTGPALSIAPVSGDQPPGQAVTITATATDASGIESVKLFYRTAGMTDYTIQTMAATGTADTYQGTIPAAFVQSPSVEYYVTATDASAAKNTTTTPDTAPDTPASFNVSAPQDTTGPAIEHTPPTDTFPANQAISLTARVTDPSGVAKVTLHYQSQGAIWKTLTTSVKGSDYTAAIPASEVMPGTLSYYFEAIDARANTAFAPQKAQAAPFTLAILSPDDTKSPGGGCQTGPAGVPYAGLLFIGLLGVLLAWRMRGF